MLKHQGGGSYAPPATLAGKRGGDYTKYVKQNANAATKKGDATNKYINLLYRLSITINLLWLSSILAFKLLASLSGGGFMPSSKNGVNTIVKKEYKTNNDPAKIFKNRSGLLNSLYMM